MPSPARQAVSSNIDDATMHELYLWYPPHRKSELLHMVPKILIIHISRPFQDAVHAGTGSIMCSYQRLNNSYGCQNSKAMNGLLKEELGFQVRRGSTPSICCRSL